MEQERGGGEMNSHILQHMFKMEAAAAQRHNSFQQRYIC